LSSTKEIKQAYRRIALVSHPDKVTVEQRDEATRTFQDIQAAYDVLQDPVRRQAYDDEIFGPEYTVADAEDESPTSPTSSFEEGRYSWSFGYGNESPRTPETPRSYAQENGSWRQERTPPFDAKREFRKSMRRPRVMSFKDASLMFRPEDRRHLWLCTMEDDPQYRRNKLYLIKTLDVSLQESMIPV